MSLIDIAYLSVINITYLSVFDITYLSVIDIAYLSVIAGVSKWAGTRYFYPPEIVYSTGRNFHKKLMITSIAEFSHSNRTTASRPS